MRVKVSPPKKLLSSDIQLPGSKSVLNRYFCLLYLSGSPIPPVSPDHSNDVQLMHSFLQFSSSVQNVEDAGTVMRFGLALSSITEGTWVLRGNERMQHRPISPLVDGLRKLGANIEYLEKENFPPLKVMGQKLTGGRVEIDASVSSQFISALLMIAPTCLNPVEIVLTGKPVSSPYIKMTCSMMERFKVGYELEKNVFRIEPQTYKSFELNSVLDWSAASFFYETLALSEAGELNFPGLFKTGLQGDEHLAQLFEILGIKTVENSEGTRIIKEKSAHLDSVKIDFIDVPDLVQPITCACFGLGMNLHLEGLYNLHLKESDRLQALVDNLQKLGAELSFAHSSGLLKGEGTILKNSELDSFNDHRMVMSLAPLSLKFGSILIKDAHVVSKSFPKFWDELKALGFEVTEIH